jgi:hypothetical protein
LMANSREAGILIIPLRCNSQCRAPERWAARSGVRLCGASVAQHARRAC